VGDSPAFALEVDRVAPIVTTIGRAQRAVVEAEHRSVFYRAWQAAHGMGATHPVALGELGLSLGRGDAERLREYLARATAARATLTDAVSAAPASLLEPFEGALLRLGEEAGTLDKSLRLLADWYAGQHKLLRKLWSRSMYPLFVTLAAVVIAPLPLLFFGHTKVYLMAAGTGIALWYLLGGNVVYLAARTQAGRTRWVRARLARSLATAMEAGATLDRAIDLAVGAAGSREIETCVKRVPLAKRRAQPLSETFRGCPRVPEELLQAMRVAEATGNWGNTVGRMGELYEDGF
jgi:type II secretion system (T2SS) protein F